MVHQLDSKVSYDVEVMLKLIQHPKSSK